MYAEGKMIKEIAAGVGMAANSIVSVLRRHGIERPTKPQKKWRGNGDLCHDVRGLWDLGLSASQIAERLNRPLTSVGSALSAAGIRDSEHPRHRYDSATPGGAGRSGFRGAVVRRT